MDAPLTSWTPCQVALAALAEAVTRLISAVESGGLDHLDAAEKLALWQGLERERRRLPVVEQALVADAQANGLAAHYAFASLPMLIARTLRVSPGSASARVRSAEAVGPRTSMLGERLDPRRPRLAEAQRAGEISGEHVHVIARTLDDLPSSVPTARVDEAEATLTDHARVFGPREVRLLARRLADAADPDGPPPDDSRQQGRRTLRLRQLKDGMWALEGRLTATLGAQLYAVLTPLARPRPARLGEDDRSDSPVDTGAAGPGGRVLPDARPHDQRMHDSLEEACARLLHAGDQPGTGGAPATVLVTVALEDLLGRTGTATTSDGTALTPDQLLRVAGEADIWTIITEARSAPLALGRTRRLASRAQTLALAVRDGGCSFPGCDRPPEWCDRHHIVDWIEGGPTDLDNLTLLCRWHHTHFAQRGWAVHLSRDRLPVWTPPRWLDPDQRPLLHERIRQRHREHTLIA